LLDAIIKNPELFSSQVWNKASGASLTLTESTTRSDAMRTVVWGCCGCWDGDILKVQRNVMKIVEARISSLAQPILNTGHAPPGRDAIRYLMFARRKWWPDRF
jgi:hypothetical protein